MKKVINKTVKSTNKVNSNKSKCTKVSLEAQLEEHEKFYKKVKIFFFLLKTFSIKIPDMEVKGKKIAFKTSEELWKTFKQISPKTMLQKEIKSKTKTK